MKPPISARDNKPVREVIGIFGGPKLGKSSGWKSIAEYEHKTGSDAKFYVIDTDGDAAQRLLAGSPHLTNVETYRAWDWDTFKASSQLVRPKAKEGDWIVIDLADRIWKFVQNYFAEKVFLDDGEDEAEYLLSLRAKWQGDKTGAPKAVAEGWDWGYINKLYDSQFLPLVMNTEAHVYIVTEMGDYSSDLEKDKTKRMIFGKVGAKMTGQKSLPYQVSTILFLDLVAGQRVLTTVGDRDGVNGPRQWLDQSPLKDFVSTYLMPVAGWKLK